jgi:hypothetical protein
MPSQTNGKSLGSVVRDARTWAGPVLSMRNTRVGSIVFRDTLPIDVFWPLKHLRENTLLKEIGTTWPSSLS